MTEKPQLTEEQKQALRRKRAAQQAQQAAAATPTVQPQAARNRSVATLVFLGSLLGTLIGTFASLNDLSESLRLVGNFFNPPTVLCVAGSNTILGEGLGIDRKSVV